MHHTGLVGPELNPALAQLGQSALEVERDGLGLRVGHQAPAAKDRSQTADVLHHVGSSDRDVEVHPPTLDLLDQVGITDEGGPGIARFLGLVALGEDQDPLLS
ncbi:hypothetical protein SDC9_201183 [bioreactor metagenome]|uniref:Uncharacterized protein n=1 Tax=bioreactor metagenome TaxID=1076179 RepID=A0A645IT07_9ZZZZ